jgi:hypothetical protein
MSRAHGPRHRADHQINRATRQILAGILLTAISDLDNPVGETRESKPRVRQDALTFLQSDTARIFAEACGIASLKARIGLAVLAECGSVRRRTWRVGEMRNVGLTRERAA